jgi:hypothetical protein
MRRLAIGLLTICLLSSHAALTFGQFDQGGGFGGGGGGFGGGTGGFGGTTGGFGGTTGGSGGSTTGTGLGGSTSGSGTAGSLGGGGNTAVRNFFETTRRSRANFFGGSTTQGTTTGGMRTTNSFSTSRGGLGGLGGLGGFGGGLGGLNGLGGLGGSTNQGTTGGNGRLRSVAQLAPEQMTRQAPAGPRVDAPRLTSRLNGSAAASRMQRVRVQMQGSTAVLRGEVATPADAKLARRLLLLEPGVSEVVNELTVATAAEQIPAEPTP